MRIRFWGARGSLPATINAADLRRRTRRVLELAAGADLSTAESRDAFLDRQLPFHLRGSYGTNTACVQVVHDGPEILLCDAGSGLRDFAYAFQRTPRARTPATFHIFITHLHWDHVMGLPFFTPVYMAGNRIVFHGHHPEIPDVIRGQFGPPTFPVPFSSLGAEFVFDVQPPGTSFHVGGFKVTSIVQNHPGLSYGYRFEKSGKAFVYSTDSEHKQDAYNPDYRFLEFFADADLLVFDAQYSLADATFSKADWGHSSNIMGVELAARARVRHLCLFHHEPTSSDEDLDEFLTNSRRYLEIYHGENADKAPAERFPHQVSLAYDGLEVPL